MKQEKAPKPIKKLTEEEARIQVTLEAFLSFNQRLFAFISKENPDLAARIKPDYDEYIQTEMDMLKKSPDYTFKDVEKVIPDNTWLKFLKETTSHMVPPQKNERIAAEFNESVRKKMEGKDIQ